MRKKKNDQVKNKDIRYMRKFHQVVTTTFFLVFAACCILFLIHIRTHVVDGQSMAPTFANGDRIFINKGEMPSRNDIITFEPKDKPGESYVKRVIGLPGDTIWLDGNKLFLNYRMSEEELSIIGTDKLARDLPDGTLKINISVLVQNQLTGLTKIPKNCYFVLGDNSKHSTDSRVLGFVKDEQIEGVVQFRYFPLNKMGFIK